MGFFGCMESFFAVLFLASYRYNLGGDKCLIAFVLVGGSRKVLSNLGRKGRLGLLTTGLLGQPPSLRSLTISEANEATGVSGRP